MTPLPLGILALAGVTGGGPAFDLLETTTLGSTTSSVTFSGLGSYSDYKHLQVRIIARNSLSAIGAAALKVDFNQVTSTSYSEHRLYAPPFSGSTPRSAATADATSINFGTIPYNNSEAGAFGVSILDIYDFSQTTKYKTTRALSGLEADLGAEDRLQLASGSLRSTAAITEMKFTTDNGSFVANTRISIYGVK